MQLRRVADVSRHLAGPAGFGLLACLAAPTASFGLEAGAVFKQADPSIVVVFAEGARAEEGSMGSGVIIAPREVVTNCHVVDKASRIVVTQGSVKRIARLRFEDLARDLCQIRLDDGFPSGKPVEKFAPSSELEVGQQVFAVGSPRGLEHTLTRGIISALRETKTQTSRVIQTDAAVSPGSSGGGLFDQEARLIGIITFGAKDSQGLNFAIPAEWIAELSTRNRSEEKPAAASPPSEQQAAGERRVGDRWKYRLNHAGRGVGTVNVEIRQVNGNRVTEQITLDGFGRFRTERDVETAFSPTRFQTAVVFPGGYQLAEIAPYFPPETELKAGQR